ncbi:FAD-dependent oxidoreductase [Tepidimonas sp.]|uniref:FAD-dependent oxidoreductase n=1 Tax=Tepidimonas sp. TaxID=2002775 RepID=UPI0028CBE801|nr:FAD-dependent oxidoreductase [Tepidimonas sp.]MDT7928841.1 NAD(P)-binding protein [Tepidimonas sp.]
MSTMTLRAPQRRAPDAPITIFGPDFPFAYDEWLTHPAGLGRVPVSRYGTEVAIVGAGMGGLTAAYELMKLGLKPVVYEASRMGGRLRSQPFEGGQGAIAELGGTRFPLSSAVFTTTSICWGWAAGRSPTR